MSSVCGFSPQTDSKVGGQNWTRAKAASIWMSCRSCSKQEAPRSKKWSFSLWLRPGLYLQADFVCPLGRWKLPKGRSSVTKTWSFCWIAVTCWVRNHTTLHKHRQTLSSESALVLLKGAWQMLCIKIRNSKRSLLYLLVLDELILLLLYRLLWFGLWIFFLAFSDKEKGSMKKEKLGVFRVIDKESSAMALGWELEPSAPSALLSCCFYTDFSLQLPRCLHGLRF